MAESASSSPDQHLEPEPEPEPEPAGSGDDTRGMSRSRLLLLTVVAAVVIAGATVAFVAFTGDSGDVVVVIPDGTGERIEASEDVELLGDEIEVSVGDKLEVTNEDDRIHQVGELTVLPGETLDYTFGAEGRFVTVCTLHANNTVTFIVT
jgi:plastocyanin